VKQLSLPYVPSDYRHGTHAFSVGEFYVSYHPSASFETVATAVELIRAALERTCALLDYFPKRRQNFCIFESVEAMRSALQRNVASGMLMVPYASNTDSLIVWHSGEGAPESSDAGRMLRHLAHEISHGFVAEITDSLKTLGDSNREVHVEPWIDEGFAECVAARVSGRDDIVITAQKALATNPGVSTNDLNKDLCDLNSPGRGEAFKYATALVLERNGGRLAECFRKIGTAAKQTIAGNNPGEPL